MFSGEYRSLLGDSHFVPDRIGMSSLCPMETDFKLKKKKGICLAHPVSRKRSSVPFALSLNFLLAS